MTGNFVQKRRFNRLPVIQPATISTRSTGVLNGEICNFSAGGLLFNIRMTAAQRLTPDLLNDQAILVQFRSPGGGNFQIPGHVVRVFERSAGISVGDFPADAWRALVLQANSATMEMLPEHPVNATERDRLLQRCEDQFQTFIRQVIGEYCHIVDTKSNVMTSDVQATRERWLLREAAQVLMRQCDRIQSAFALDYPVRLRNLEEDRQESQPLALVETEVLDDWLSVSQLINRLNQDYLTEISQFELRYATLTGQPLLAKRNPYGPHAIMWVFHQVFAEHSLSAQLKILLYDAFFQAVSRFCVDFYQNLNVVLSDIDIQPAIVRRSSVSSVAQHSSVSAGANVGNDPFSTQSVSELSRLQQVPQTEQPTVAQTVADDAEAVVTGVPMSMYLEAARLSSSLRQGTEQGEQEGRTTPISAATPAPRVTTVEIPDSGLNQLLWQFNWLGKQSGFNTSILDVLTELPDASRQMDDEYDAVSVWELSSEGELGRMIWFSDKNADSARLDASCALAGLNAWRESIRQGVADRLASGKLNDEAWLMLSNQMVAEQIPEPCRLALAKRLQLLAGWHDETVRWDMLTNDLPALIRKLTLGALPHLLQEDDVLVQAKHPVYQTIVLLDAFHAVADDTGKLYDERLSRLLELLVLRVIEQGALRETAWLDATRQLLSLSQVVGVTRGRRVTQIQTAGNRALPVCTQFVLEAWQLDEDSLVLSALSVGDWLALPQQHGMVPWQILVAGTQMQPWVLSNRAATTVLEYDNKTLHHLFGQQGWQVLPEFGTHLRYRARLREKLDDYAVLWMQTWRVPKGRLWQKSAALARLDWILQRTRHASSHLQLAWVQLQTEPDATESVCLDVFSRLSVLASQVISIGHLIGNTGFVLFEADPEQAPVLLQEILLAVPVRQFGISAAHDGFSCARQWLAQARLAAYFSRRAAQGTAAARSVGAPTVWMPGDLVGRRRLWAGMERESVQEEYLLQIRWKAGHAARPQRRLSEMASHTLADDVWQLQQLVEKEPIWQRNPHALLNVGLAVQNLCHAELREWLRIVGDRPFAARLVFRFSEAVVATNLSAVMNFVRVTRDYGFRYCLNDVGSIYHDLTWLRHWKPDMLCLPSYWVKQLPRVGNVRTLVRDVREVVVAMGMTMRAQAGNEAEFLALRSLGVNWIAR
jgi:hypothetical protein